MSTPSTPPAAPAGHPAKEPLVKHPGRVLTVIVALGAVITLMIVAITSAQTDTGDTRNAGLLPSSVEKTTPGIGELIRRQDTSDVDLRDDLTGVLIIQPPDGPRFEVPEDQTDRVVPLGLLSWRTGPGRELEEFEAGSYKATVLYWPQAKGRPEQPSGYTWEFRVGA